MEVLVEQPTAEKCKHFDVLASINLMRFDLMKDGYVRSETKQRIYDEELSYVAEGLDRPMSTVFVLREINGEFVYFDKGEWRPYRSMLTSGILSAQIAAEEDPRKTFLTDMAVTDYLIAQQWHGLGPGEKMHWYSAFRERELQLYGEQFMNSLGFQSRRRMGFIYQAEKDYEGNLILTSQSVDNSDEEAFEAAMKAAWSGENARRAYDQHLEFKHGRKYRAGRLHENEENAWDIIQRHKDLINHYFEQLEKLASNYFVSQTELERRKKRLTYGFWAAIKERLDKAIHGPIGNQLTRGPIVPITQEIAGAYARLQAKGEVLFGCGGAIGTEDPLMEADPDKVFDSIFGKSAGEDKHGSLTFKCQKGHINTRPRNQLIDKCKTCGISVKC